MPEPVLTAAADPKPIGAYRRRIELATRRLADSSQEARIAIEDDHHHFRISVFAKDGVVTEVAGQPLRVPNLICPSASSQLYQLAGKLLDGSYAATLGMTDIRQHCTHLAEMASLGMVMLARDVPRRTYEAEVRYDDDAGRPVDSRSTATLRRDGQQVMQWRMQGLEITDPDPYAGRSIVRGFTPFVSELDDETGEAALVLRRAIFTSFGRGQDLDAVQTPRAVTEGQCWAWQKERADRAVRNIGSTLDFDPNPEALTADDRTWIAFEGWGQ
jgi:hypothetical protein